MDKDINYGKGLEYNSQAISMFKFISRVRRFFLYSVFVVITLVFFLVFQPMQTELKKSLTETFTHISETNYYLVENHIKRCIEGAKSLSSRTMIKNAIGEYKSKKISLEELKTYTQEKYEDGAKAIDNIVIAKRIVDGSLIAMYQAEDEVLDDSLMKTEKGQKQEVTSKIILRDGKICAVIESPISIENKAVGYDYVVYDLTKQIKQLSTKKIEVYLDDDKKCQELLNASSKFGNKSGITTFMKDRTVYWVAPIENMYFVSTQKQATLYEPIYQLAKRIVIGVAITFTGLILVIYLYIFRYVKKELGTLESSRNAYKKIAYTDHLTGAYSRQFLDVWNKSLRSYNSNYVVIEIDVDDFKTINDVYGHATGDKVLQQLASTILNSIRQSDLLVRYGGDEFVIILSDIDTEAARNLMARIEEQLALSSTDSVQIKISYGMSLLIGNSDLQDLLKQADSRMYEAKKAKKTGQKRKNGVRLE